MNLPNIVAVGALPFGLPAVKNNQAWAINQDTSPPSLVLVEFVYADSSTSAQSASQESVNLLNTSLNQTISSISSDLSSLINRVANIESVLNTSSFISSPSG